MGFEGKYWTQSVEDTLASLYVSSEKGLDQKTISQRHKKYGSNRLREIKQKSSVAILIEQFKSPIMALLAVNAGTDIFRNEVTTNPFVWGALALCAALLTATTFVPGLAQVLKVAAPGKQGWGLIIIMSFVPLLLGQAYKIAAKSRSGSNQKSD